MKKVFNYDELAHIWAQQTQSEGRTRESRMFFRDSMIFSYGHHFCIARILPDKTVVFTTRDYSPTTSSHKAAVRSAVSHRKVVYCYRPDWDAKRNKDDTERSIKTSLENAKTKRKVLPKTRVESKLAALAAATEFNEYLAALPPAERKGCRSFNLVKLEVSAEERQLLQEYDAAREIKRQEWWSQRSARWDAAEAKRTMDLADKIVEWRANTYNHSLHHVPTMLRLSKDGENVETSEGANIPVSHAKRLWTLIQQVRQGMVPVDFTERTFRIGHYTLDRIEASGDIVVGCHNIAYSEIVGIAESLGLSIIPEGAAA